MTSSIRVLHHFLPVCALFFGTPNLAMAQVTEPVSLGTIVVKPIDWTRLRSEPLRKQKQTVDVGAVSDPVLASAIVDAAEPILRFLIAVMYAEPADTSDPKVRQHLETPNTVVRFPPAGVSRWRPKFIHQNIYDWRLTGSDEIKFTVRYQEISGKQYYTDDYCFVRMNGAWLFRGHVSDEATSIQIRATK